MASATTEWKKVKVQELPDLFTSGNLETENVNSSGIKRVQNSAQSDITVSAETSPLLEGITERLEEEEVKNESDVPGVTKGQDSSQPVEGLANGESTQKTCAAKQLIVIQKNGATNKIEEGKPVILADVPLHGNISSTQGGAAPVSDLEKKQRRAERFGVDVKMSEDEKKKLRAARFGAASGVEKPRHSPSADSGKTSPTSKESEDEKKKARAARFGISEPAGKLPCEEDAKKRARLARFGPSTDAGADSLLEGKKKARAARFGSAVKEEMHNAEKESQRVEAVSHV